MIYLEPSAPLKLLHQEPQSAALADLLSARAGPPVVSKELAKVEVLRACRRVNDELLPEPGSCWRSWTSSR
ncbi:MAG TPA: hypothetical protein VGO80_09800 [Solirubrobacteraceae bacterium]|nr:hypothetical protein [Solirubrobacteraceae bacterium]